MKYIWWGICLNFFCIIIGIELIQAQSEDNYVDSLRACAKLQGQNAQNGCRAQVTKLYSDGERRWIR